MPINLTYFTSFIPLEQGLVGSVSEDTFLIHISDSRAQVVGKAETAWEEYWDQDTEVIGLVF